MNLRVTITEFTNWSKWSQCPVTCGNRGIKKRTRRCLDKGQPSAGCVGTIKDEKQCPGNPCPSMVLCVKAR